MNSVQQIKQRWYVFGVVLITATLLFSTYLPATGRPSSQEGISQPQAFSSGGTMNLQGQLSDHGGNPLNGSYNMRFAIYNSASGGSKNWPASEYEHHPAVPVSNGLFSVQLGSISNAINSSVFHFGGDRYLQVWVCSTNGAGCVAYDDMGRLPISSAAFANHLTGPLRLITSDPSAIYAQNSNPTGVGLFGLASDFNGINYGVYGSSNSREGFGVFGFANNTMGIGYGVYGETTSTAGGGSGVYGKAPSTSGFGVIGSGRIGVYGYSTNTTGTAVNAINDATSGVNYGVRGRVASPEGRAIEGLSQNSNGFAGYFQGNVSIIGGTLTKPAGSFKIDHPLDPENKYLYHSFVESPDMKNIYDGVVILDQNGEALVTMPEWFEALNQEFRYQLTALGAAMPNLHISQKVLGNSFRIAGGEPGMEVSWQVTGIRHDPYAEENRIPIEEDKTQDEIGKFLYPQGYGLSEEFSVNYNPEMMAGLEALTVNE